MKLAQLSWLVAGQAKGGRSRLIGTAAGVAVGVALLLLVFAAYNGLVERNQRQTWAMPQGAYISTADDQGKPIQQPPLGPHEAYVNTQTDTFRGQQFTRVDVATATDTTMAIPGVGTPPQPGEYRASPALARLIADTPQDQLGDRFGTDVGRIGAAGLADPDALVVVVGVPEAALEQSGSTMRIDRFAGYAFPSDTYRVLAIVGGIAILFPVLVLIFIVTRLGQAARAERFATIRLIGATPALVARIAALEIGVAALLGGGLGVGLFWALRPLAAEVPIENGRFFLADLSVDPLTQVLVPVLTAGIAAVVAFTTTLRADLGPLGASREQRERVPRGVAMIPLILGIAALLGLRQLRHMNAEWADPQLVLYGFILGFALVLIGLLLAGPYLTSLVSGFAARRAGHPASLLATSRIRRHPRAIFRAVSGLVLAVFVVTTFAVAATTETGEELVDVSADELIQPDVLIARIEAPVQGYDPRRSARAVETVAGIPGVTTAALAYWPVGENGESNAMVLDAAEAAKLGIPVGSERGWAQLDAGYTNNWRPSGPVQVEHLSKLPPGATQGGSGFIFVQADSPGALERARTALISAELPLTATPMTRAEGVSLGALSWASRYAALASIGMLIAMLISAIALTVATIAGVLDRRRVLGLLRLTGMPLSTLRSMVALETAVPLLTVLLLSAGAGVFVAWALVTGLNEDRTVQAPGLDYLLTLGAGLVLAVIAVLASFRAVKRFTSAAATRFE